MITDNINEVNEFVEFQKKHGDEPVIVITKVGGPKIEYGYCQATLDEFSFDLHEMVHSIEDNPDTYKLTVQLDDIFVSMVITKQNIDDLKEFGLDFSLNIHHSIYNEFFNHLCNHVHNVHKS